MVSAEKVTEKIPSEKLQSLEIIFFIPSTLASNKKLSYRGTRTHVQAAKPIHRAEKTIRVNV